MRRFYVIFGAAVRPDGRPSGTLERRVRGALAAAGSAPDAVYVATGGQGRYGDAEAEVMRRLLVENGVAETRIVTEPKSGDTLDSIVACSAILADRAQPGDAVAVCTSRYHGPRCALLFGLAGVRATIAPALSDRGRVAPARLVRSWLREVPAVLWDTLLLAGMIAIGRVKRVRVGR